MTNIEFVSQESFPEDPYIKELVYLCLEGKYRVAYIRKESKNGGKYWGVISSSIVKHGTKSYYESFMQDSSFLDKDIKDFLEKRKWESQRSVSKVLKQDDELPF